MKRTPSRSEIEYEIVSSQVVGGEGVFDRMLIEELGDNSSTMAWLKEPSGVMGKQVFI